ncbi:MAG: LptE family protein [Pirellulales bacterium]
MIARRTICCLVLALSIGCAGYHVGNRTLYAPHIKTVYVPMFESDSFRRNLGEWLTEAVVKEIELKTPYKVVGDSSADSVLTGRILTVTKRVLVEDPTDQAREINVYYAVQVTWASGQGELLQTPARIPLPMSVVHFGEGRSVIPEAGQSTAVTQQTIVTQLAEDIVATMETPW